MNAPPPTDRLRLRAAAVAAIVTVAIAAGCGPQPPSVDGLLVAADGLLLVTNPAGQLVAFDGPSGPAISVAASDGRVVVAIDGGALVTSSKSSTTRSWQPLPAPVLGGAVRFMALSPTGRTLALAEGDPEASSFELVLLDLGSGTSRSIAVDRGLNGPPAWIGPGTVAIDVIKPNGSSAIAAVDVTTGALVDDAFGGIAVSASDDRRHVAVDDRATGDVLVGELDGQALGPLQRVTRLVGPAGAGVDVLAMSPDGTRLAVIRRADPGAASLELYRRLEQGWTSRRIISLAGDGPVSIAWLH
jgi:hypothetical protein